MRKSRSKKLRKRRNRALVFLSVIGILLFMCGIFIYRTILEIQDKKAMVENTPKQTSIDTVKTKTPANTKENETKEKEKPIASSAPKEVTTEVLLSSIGDCTLGTDPKFGYVNSFPYTLAQNQNNYGYFFKNVASILSKDDITTANLETTFTEAVQKADKQFTFKGPKSYTEILKKGSVEGVTLSNNHIYDYNQQGFNDTVKALKESKISYFGENYVWNTSVKGQAFTFLGYKGWSNDAAFLSKLKTDIQKAKQTPASVVIHFHWGGEGEYTPNAVQKQLAHYAIDQGADLILGHHPHVIQGIEQYKGKVIAYSLGNFCFGGNFNPRDKRTFILQTKFKFTGSDLSAIGVKVVPCSISSVTFKNDYCPTPLTGEKKTQFFKTINELSPKAGFTIKDDFFFINVNNTKQ